MATIEEMQVKLTMDLSELNAKTDQLKAQMDSLGKHVSDQKAPVEGLKGAFKELGKVMVEAFAATEVFNFLKESAKAASENAASMAGLDITLKNVTGTTKDQAEAIHKQLEEHALVSNQVASDLVPAYSQLVASTKDTSKAMGLLSLAQDVAAQKHKDVTTVALALSRAAAGNSAALNKLAPETKHSADAFAVLAKESKGAAAAVGNADPMAKMQAQFKLIQETLGKALLPLMTAFTQILMALMPAITSVADFLGKLVKAFMPIINALMSLLMPILKSVLGIFINLAQTALPIVIGALKLLMPFLQLAAGLLNVVLEAVNFLAKGFSIFANILVNAVGKAIKAFLDQFGPLGKAIEGLFNGLMKIAGIKISDKTFKITADTSGLGNLSLPNLNVGGSTGSGSGSSSASAEKTLLKSLATIRQNILDAQKKFNTDLAQLQSDYATKIAGIQKDFQAKLVDVINQSKALLINAFQQATNIDVGSMFASSFTSNSLSNAVTTQVKNGLTTVVSWWGSAQSGGGVAGLLNALQTKLAASKQLSDNAAKLAGAGFSQTFIDQIVAQGTDLGNQMASAILAASPETQRALQDVFAEANAVSAHGVDALATQLYNTQGLATEALRNLYTKTEQDFKDALTAADAQFNADSQKLYDDLQKSLADANAKMAEALQTAADAMGVSLTTIKSKYKDEIGQITDLITKVRKEAKAALDDAQAAAKAMAEQAYTSTTQQLVPSGVSDGTPKPAPYDPTKQVGGGANPTQGYGTGINVQTFVQSNADPNQISTSIVNAIKLNNPTVVSSGWSVPSFVQTGAK